jgi:hypothetical protein
VAITGLRHAAGGLNDGEVVAASRTSPDSCWRPHDSLAGHQAELVSGLGTADDVGDKFGTYLLLVTQNSLLH